jgi:hypothetical protein
MNANSPRPRPAQASEHRELDAAVYEAMRFPVLAPLRHAIRLWTRLLSGQIGSGWRTLEMTRMDPIQTFAAPARPIGSYIIRTY